MASSDYLDSILRGQAQSKVTGRGALTSPQIEAAFRGELGARYESDVSRSKEAFQESATTRGLDISQQEADTQKQSMLNAKDATDAQIAAGNKQTIVSGVGAMGQAAIGGALVKKAFFDSGTTAGTGSAAAISSATEAAAQAGTLAASSPGYVAAGGEGVTSSGALVYGSPEYGAAVTDVTGLDAGSKGAVTAVEELGTDAAVAAAA